MLRLDGALPLSTIYIKKNIFKTILDVMGSQERISAIVIIVFDTCYDYISPMGCCEAVLLFGLVFCSNQ